MTTKEVILKLADDRIRDQGYNAFSFHDIAKTMGIKTASIHYHFPTKSDLGVGVVSVHIQRLESFILYLQEKSPLEKLEALFQVYYKIMSENKICIVGSLSTDFNTVDLAVQEKLKDFTDLLLNWLTKVLDEGKDLQVFKFDIPARTKALMIMSNMMAIVQLSRVTKKDDFGLIKNTILDDLTK